MKTNRAIKLTFLALLSAAALSGCAVKRQAAADITSPLNKIENKNIDSKKSTSSTFLSSSSKSKAQSQPEDNKDINLFLKKTEIDHRLVVKISGIPPGSYLVCYDGTSNLITIKPKKDVPNKILATLCQPEHTWPKNIASPRFYGSKGCIRIKGIPPGSGILHQGETPNSFTIEIKPTIPTTLWQPKDILPKDISEQGLYGNFVISGENSGGAEIIAAEDVGFPFSRRFTRNPFARRFTIVNRSTGMAPGTSLPLEQCRKLQVQVPKNKPLIFINRGVLPGFYYVFAQ